MTKKDYVLVAAALRAGHASAETVRVMADRLQAEYRGGYSFKYDTFIEAASPAQDRCAVCTHPVQRNGRKELIHSEYMSVAFDHTAELA